MHVLVMVLTRRLTLINAGVLGGWWPAGALDSAPFTLHNWMRRGALQAPWPWWHRKKNGRGQQHFHICGTSSCWLCVASGISHGSPSPLPRTAELRAQPSFSFFFFFCWKPNIDDDIQWHTYVQPPPFEFIACLCKPTKTRLSVFLKWHWASVFNQGKECVLLWFKVTYFNPLVTIGVYYLVTGNPVHVRRCFGTN